MVIFLRQQTVKTWQKQIDRYVKNHVRNNPPDQSGGIDNERKQNRPGKQ